MRIDNDPDGKLYEVFLGTAFQKSPYRWLTIGRTKDLLQLTVQDLQKFWERHYHPSNAVGVLVGKINLREAETLLRETFGKVSFPQKSVLPQGAPKKYEEEPPQREERRVEVSWKARPRLWIGYHKPSLPHPDDAYLDLVSEILAKGRSSRLYKRLVLDRGLVSGLSSSNGSPGIRLSNLFILQMDLLERHQRDEVIRTIDEEITSFLSQPITKAEMKKAKNKIRISQIALLERHSGLASELSYFEAVAGGWRNLTRYMDQVEGASEDDLKQVVKNYLTKSNRTVAFLRP
jgi:predicted Zn-dependent peptidase